MNEVTRRDGLIPPFFSADGFSLVEVLVSMCLTTLVLGAVFGILSQWSVSQESDRARLQAEVSLTLSQITRDVVSAGVDLPPEFPVFTPYGGNPELIEMGAGSDVIEMVGNMGGDAAGQEAVVFTEFDGEIAKLESSPAHIQVGDLVLLYDDLPTNGKWMFALVSSVTGGETPTLVLVVGPDEPVKDTTLPWFIERYNRSQPTSGYITPVKVIGYFAADDVSAEILPGKRVLWRQVNWGLPSQVASVESLDIRYLIGSTVCDPIQVASPSLDDEASPGREVIVGSPPRPQPYPEMPIDPGCLLRGVRVTVTGRLDRPNVLGSSLLPGQEPDEDGYLRVTYSSRVTTRNILFGMATRRHGDGFN